MSSSQTLLDQIIIPLISGKSVLDAGCGYGRWASLIHSNFWEAGMKKPPVVDGFDAFLPNVNFCSKTSFYRKVWQQKLPSEIKGKWDTVLAVEIIEHIPQRDVSKTLDALEKAAKKRVIISTPNFPAYREGSNTKLGFNKYEAHLSHMPARFLKKRGYKILSVGMVNPDLWLVKLLKLFMKKSKRKKSVQGENSISKIRAFDLIPLIFSKLGHTLIAYKDVGEDNE
jgi:SAM-dependent methyltransferase